MDELDGALDCGAAGGCAAWRSTRVSTRGWRRRPKANGTTHRELSDQKGTDGPAVTGQRAELDKSLDRFLYRGFESDLMPFH
jgi:hypothetical protein